MAKLPAHMNQDEIVVEVKRLHGEIEHSASRMSEMCKLLLSRSRPAALRTAANGQHDLSDAVIRRAEANVVYANAWLRLSGLVTQAIKRTRVADRSLTASQRQIDADDQDAKERAVREARRLAYRETKAATQEASPVADLMELYGEEIMNDATR